MYSVVISFASREKPPGVEKYIFPNTQEIYNIIEKDVEGDFKNLLKPTFGLKKENEIIFFAIRRR
jgi:hypothetical protein